MAVSAVAYMLRSRLYRRLPAFAVHASFAVILAGALTSWLTSEHGTLRLKDGAEASAFTLDDGSVAKCRSALSCSGLRLNIMPERRRRWTLSAICRLMG